MSYIYWENSRDMDKFYERYDRQDETIGLLLLSAAVIVPSIVLALNLGNISENSECGFRAQENLPVVERVDPSSLEALSGEDPIINGVQFTTDPSYIIMQR